jgi:hypothetical protein
MNTLKTLVLAACAGLSLSACADNGRYYDDRGANSYESRQSNTSGDTTFRSGQIEK